MFVNPAYQLLTKIAALCTADECNLPAVQADAPAFQKILSIVFMIIGAAAVGFIVYGGLRYAVSAGSPEETRKAKDIILYAVVGLIASLLAFTVVNFVVSRFIGP